MNGLYLDAMKKFEGFTSGATWDYAQFSNGYGTRARFAGEVITPQEADRRFQAEVAEARKIVERAASSADEGTKAALTSLTYNAGPSWTKGGLGEAVRSGDLDAVRDIFQKYNKAGGEVLPGLVSRRAQEALWIGNPSAVGAANVVASGPTSAHASVSGSPDAGPGEATASLPPIVLADADPDQETKVTGNLPSAFEILPSLHLAQSDRVQMKHESRYSELEALFGSAGRGGQSQGLTLADLAQMLAVDRATDLKLRSIRPEDARISS